MITGVLGLAQPAELELGAAAVAVAVAPQLQVMAAGTVRPSSTVVGTVNPASKRGT